jgi:hypothetical protein
MQILDIFLHIKIILFLNIGTISGPEKGNYGSMLEISWSGKEAITLSNGE